MGYDDHDSTTELYSHITVAVAGAQCSVISRTGLHANVAAYSPDLLCKRIEIFDVSIAYNFPYTLETTLIVIQND